MPDDSTVVVWCTGCILRRYNLEADKQASKTKFLLATKTEENEHVTFTHPFLFTLNFIVKFISFINNLIKRFQ